MAAIPFYKSVYGTHFLAGDSRHSRSLDHRAMAGATVSYRLTSLLSPIDSSPVIVSKSLIGVDLSTPVIILKFWFWTRQILLKLLSDVVLHAAMMYSKTGRTYPT